MKKKILFGLLFGLILFPNVVSARTSEACSTEENYATLRMNGVAGKILSQYFPGAFEADTTYFQMSLDGTKAMCVSHGKKANSENKYSYVGPVTNIQYKQGYNFYINNSYGNSLYSWAIGQIITWHGVNDGMINIIISKDRTLKTDAERMAKKASVLGSLNGGGQYYIWKNETIPGGQDMISTLSGCRETSEDLTCPKGSMVKSGSLAACSVAKGGIESSGFSNSPTGGDRADVHINYGEEMGLSGNEFCRVYCKETGSAVTPGAFGEALQLGSYMIWPTSQSNSNSKFYKEAYPLKFTGTLSCKIGVIPDENMPFACKRDPVEEYKNYYNYLYSNKDSQTLNRISSLRTLELLRKQISSAILESPDYEIYHGWCHNAYNSYANTTNNEYVYDHAVERLNHFTEEWRKAVAYRDKVPSTLPDTTTVTSLEGVTTTIPTTKPNPEWEARDAKVQEFEKYVIHWNSIVEQLEVAMKSCANYIYNFEMARHILIAYKACAEYDANESMYGFTSTASFVYRDENNEDIVDIFPENEESSSAGEMNGNHGLIQDQIKTNPKLPFENLLVQTSSLSGDLSDVVSQIKSREFSITKSQSYMLETDYSYLNKDKLKYTKSKPEGNANYIKFDKTVIPTSYDNKTGKNDFYYLKLNNMTFGMAGFGADDNGNGMAYSCPVQFTKTRTPDTCICPEGTANAGKDLTCMIKDSDMTCPDAKIQYCESVSVEIPEECGGLYCDAPYEYISLGSCINSGGTIESCKNSEVCSSIKCPNTAGVDDAGMDDRLRDCVQVKVNQGLSKTQAIAICEPLVCQYNGKRIIYRTIRLENPFPSYNTYGVKQNTITGMFNNNVKGRYPGSNWNGVLTVYNKIRNNRSGSIIKNESSMKNSGLIGTGIYQKKEPLYRFVLNGTTIQKIRDYNSNRSYNDFNGRTSEGDDSMDCKINKSVACVSSFVHNTSLSGLVSGECINATGKNSFYVCAAR